MSETNQTSEITLTKNANLLDALSKAQAEFPVIPKDSEVEVHHKETRKLLYTYKYADLTTIIDCTRPALKKFGLGFYSEYSKEKGCFFTVLFLKDETLECGFVPCKIDDRMDMKQVAGLYTYGKRISLTAALGISADEDVDAAAVEAQSGNSTNKPGQKPAEQKPPQNKPQNHAPGAQASAPPQGPRKPSQAQLKRLYAIAGTAGWPAASVRMWCVAHINCTPGDMSIKQYDQLCKFLEGAPYDEAQEEQVNQLFYKLTADQLALLDMPPVDDAPFFDEN